MLWPEVTPVMDRTYPLSEAPEAIRYLEMGHARAKSSSPCKGSWRKGPWE
ncbi:zinc-binding dehydrogenase [Streptomyces sp. NPDC051219]